MPSANFRNITLNVVGESIWGLQAAMVATATVLTVLLRKFGAGKTMIGSLVAIELGATAGLQFLGLYVFTSRRRRKRQLLLWHFFVIIPFLFLIGAIVGLSSHWPTAFSRWAILICFAGFNCAIGVVIAAWTDWLAHIFDVRIRGAAMGLGFSGSALAGTAGALLAGELIRLVHFPRAYCYLYLIAGALALVSIAVFWLVKDPAENAPSDSCRPDVSTMITRARASLRDRTFRAFLVGRTLATVGFCVVPFITVYYTSADGGGLPASTVVSHGAAMTVGSALASFGLGRLGDLWGHRLGILIGAWVQVATLLVVLSLRGKVGCLLAFAGVGICGGAGFISHYNMLFETCPHDHRVAHIVVGNLIIGVAGIVAALLSGVVAAWWGVRVLFYACSVPSVAALLWFTFFVKEPRAGRLSS